MEAGFDKSDRGQMIMACGTGKTLVSHQDGREHGRKGRAGPVRGAVNIPNAPGHQALVRTEGNPARLHWRVFGSKRQLW